MDYQINFSKILNTLEKTERSLNESGPDKESRYFIITMLVFVFFSTLESTLDTSSFIRIIFLLGIIISSMAAIIIFLLSAYRTLKTFRERKKNERSLLMERAIIQTPKLATHVSHLSVYTTEELKKFKDWLSHSLKTDAAIVTFLIATITLLPKAIEIITSSFLELGLNDYLFLTEKPFIGSTFLGVTIGLKVLLIIAVLIILFFKTTLPTHLRYLFYVNYTIDHGFDRETKN